MNDGGNVGNDDAAIADLPNPLDDLRGVRWRLLVAWWVLGWVERRGIRKSRSIGKATGLGTLSCGGERNSGLVGDNTLGHNGLDGHRIRS